MFFLQLLLMSGCVLMKGTGALRKVQELPKFIKQLLEMYLNRTKKILQM